MDKLYKMGSDWIMANMNRVAVAERGSIMASLQKAQMAKDVSCNMQSAVGVAADVVTVKRQEEKIGAMGMIAANKVTVKQQQPLEEPAVVREISTLDYLFGERYFPGQVSQWTDIQTAVKVPVNIPKADQEQEAAEDSVGRVAHEPVEIKTVEVAVELVIWAKLGEPVVVSIPRDDHEKEVAEEVTDRATHALEKDKAEEDNVTRGSGTVSAYTIKDMSTRKPVGEIVKQGELAEESVKNTVVEMVGDSAWVVTNTVVWNLTFVFIVLRSGKISCQFQPMNKIDCQSIEWERFL
jgi:hypothetical protein